MQGEGKSFFAEEAGIFRRKAQSQRKKFQHHSQQKRTQ